MWGWTMGLAQNLDRRPRVEGRALSVDTWDQVDPSVPKLRETIEVVDPGLTLTDRKVLNAILAHSYETLLQNPNQVFAAPASDIRRAIGWTGHNGNAEIFEALLRLQQTVVVVGYVSDGALRHRRLTMLITTDVPKSAGTVFWRFHPELAPLLANPEQYARIYLAVSARFTSGYAVRLYEILSLYVNRHNKVWDVDLDTLRQLLGATAKSYQRFADLNRKALIPAMAEINSYAPFSVSCRIERRAGKRESTHAVFTVDPREMPRPGRPAVPLPTPRLPDLLGEAPAPTAGVNPARLLAGRVRASTLEEAARLWPGVDIDAELKRWSAAQVRQGRSIARPGDAFTGWMRAVHGVGGGEREGGAEAPAAASTAVPLSPREHRAVAVVADLHPSKREAWLNIALKRRPELRPRVPNTAKEYLRVWVPEVMDDLQVAGMI
jgi:hypothetical protein